MKLSAMLPEEKSVIASWLRGDDEDMSRLQTVLDAAALEGGMISDRKILETVRVIAQVSKEHEELVHGHFDEADGILFFTPESLKKLVAEVTQAAKESFIKKMEEAADGTDFQDFQKNPKLMKVLEDYEEMLEDLSNGESLRTLLSGDYEKGKESFYFPNEYVDTVRDFCSEVGPILGWDPESYDEAGDQEDTGCEECDGVGCPECLV